MKRLLTLSVAILSLINIAAAREVISLNDNWRFYFSLENSADYARTITLPHTWAYGQSQSIVSNQPTMANYLRDLFVPAEWSNKRVFIKFYGVQTVADILVNGRYVGEHSGGATAFTFELTKFLKFGESNRVQVMVNDAPQNDILPTSHEENIYGGIYRDVELIVTDRTAISPLHYGSDGVFVECTELNQDSAEGEVKVFLNSLHSSSCKLILSIFDPSNTIVEQKIISKAKIDDMPVSIPFSVKSPALWSPQKANLYRFVVRLMDNELSDQVEVVSGFRTIEVVESGLLKINGEPTQFRGVSLYHDYPHVGGAASKCDIDADMEIINELGANAIRSVSHPHHQYLYDLCDREGKMVWIDFPLQKAPFLSDIAYYPTQEFHDQGIETMREIIAQNYNHPSVVMWGIFSLLTTRGDNPIPYIQELNSLAKRLDPRRPTVAVSDQDGDINKITDLIVWNQNIGWDKGHFPDIDMWSNILHTKWSSMISAVTYGQNGRMDQQSEAKDYKSMNVNNSATWKPEGRQRVFHEEYSKRLLNDSLFWGVCLNSMFDFRSSRNSLGENNTGLVTFDRRSRKDIFYLYKAHWNKQESTLHIADSRLSKSSSPLYSLSVYASDTIPPTLITAKDTITMKPSAPWHFVAEELPLSDGVNKFVVRQGELADSVTVTLESPASMTLKPSARRFR